MVVKSNSQTWKPGKQNETQSFDSLHIPTFTCHTKNQSSMVNTPHQSHGSVMEKGLRFKTSPRSCVRTLFTTSCAAEPWIFTPKWTVGNQRKFLGSGILTYRIIIKFKPNLFGINIPYIDGRGLFTIYNCT